MAYGRFQMRVYDDLTQLPLMGVVPVITGVYVQGVHTPMNVPLDPTDDTGWTGFSTSDVSFLYEITIQHSGYLKILDIVTASETLPPPIVNYYLLIDEDAPPNGEEPPPVLPSGMSPLVLTLIGVGAFIYLWREG